MPGKTPASLIWITVLVLDADMDDLLERLTLDEKASLFVGRTDDPDGLGYKR